MPPSTGQLRLSKQTDFNLSKSFLFFIGMKVAVYLESNEKNKENSHCEETSLWFSAVQGGHTMLVFLYEL